MHVCVARPKFLCGGNDILKRLRTSVLASPNVTIRSP